MSPIHDDWDNATAYTIPYNYTDPAATTDWLSTIREIGASAQSLITGLTALQIQQINIRRIGNGLPPLDPSLTSPQIGLNLSPQTMQMIMYAALGIGAIMLLKGRR